MPEPRDDEARDKFLQRCMADPEAVSDFPDTRQRYAFCTATWRESREETDMQAALALAAERIEDKTLTGVPVFPIGTFTTDKYGEVTLDRELAETVVANFAAGVLGTDVQLDAGHSEDEAYGWVRKLYTGTFSHPRTGEDVEAVLADIELTELGASAIEGKRYRYLSAKLGPYTDTETGDTHMVMRSVALTNQPVMRIMPALELAEHPDGDADIELAWSDVLRDEQTADSFADRVVARISEWWTLGREEVNPDGTPADDSTAGDEPTEGGSTVSDEKVTVGEQEYTFAELTEMQERAAKYAEVEKAEADRKRAEVTKLLADKGVSQPSIELAEAIMATDGDTVELSDTDGNPESADITDAMRRFAEHLSVAPVEETGEHEQERETDDDEVFELSDVDAEWAKGHGTDPKHLLYAQVARARDITMDEARTLVDKREEE